MRRLLALLAALALALGLAAPAVLAADPAMPHNGRVLISTSGDVTIPAGEHADAVFVVEGTATIRGEVNTVVAIEGAVVLEGARVESVVAVRGPVTIGDGSVVLDDVLKLDSVVTRVGTGTIDGTIRDMGLELASAGVFLAPAIFLLYVGFALATVVAALLLAALAGRQVRSAGRVISREPLAALLIGIVGAFVPFFVVAALVVTIVGAPLAFGILFGLLPLTAFVGYLVAAIWVGDWLLRQTTQGEPRERPILAALVGTVLLQILGVFPLVTFVASLFGYGAVLIVAWRTLTGSTGTTPVAPRVTAPLAGPVGP